MGTQVEAHRERAATGPAVVAGWVAVWLLTAGMMNAVAQQADTPAAPPAPRARVIELRIGGQVDPILAEYLNEGIERAGREQASLVLITMDTPGGLGNSMQDIIQGILTSPVPVVVYVAPSGARGASAGFFILLAADVAAMAPGTHAGAASPLAAIGGIPLDVNETIRNKLLNDATAFLRSYAEKRGRNVSLAETAVTEGKAFTDTEALDGNLIDVIAGSPEDLLEQLDGRTVARFDGETIRLDLDSPERIAVEMSARQRFLSRLVQPDAFFILLIVGVLGLYTEFTHPGLIVPGVIGGIAIVLALFAMHLLPVNFAGLLLIVLALALFILEAMYTSHGVLAIGGVAAMLLGALMLIRSPLTGAGVSLGTALGVTVPAAILTILLMRLVLRARSWKQSTGPEELVDAVAEVTEALETSAGEGLFMGMVRLHGELWRALAGQKIPAGARVQVVRVAGLTVHVAPAGETNSRPS